MEALNHFNSSFQTEISHKMELEKIHKINHDKMVKNYILSKRKMNTFPFNMNNPTYKKNLICTFDINLFFKNIDEITILFNKLHFIYNQDLNKINKAEIDSIKNSLLQNLKQIRKELSRENISLIEAKTIFENNKTQNFINLLINPFLNINDPYIHLELLWILNNLIFLIAKYKNNISFDINNIPNYLITFLINKHKGKKNEGVKYTLEEKILRIFGNLIHINNNIIELLINNQIITFIIDSLNNPVPSFRTTCLWLLNKILLIFKKFESSNYIHYFTNKNAISNYKFIFTRIENKKSFEEMGELFWLLNELVKYDSTILVPIFFNDININNNMIYINNELACKKFEFVLSNCLTIKMFQPGFRLISNILIVCLKDVKDENLLNILIEHLYENQSVVMFIKDVLNSPKNKYDILLVKDILLLIFNLIHLSQIKSCVLFRNDIINLINDKDYQNDNELMKLLFFIYYKIIASNSFFFEPNDEKVIKACLVIMERFKDDNIVLIIFIDILYYYLKASNIKIGDDVKNELNLMMNSQENILVERLQYILLKLVNFVRIHLPLSGIKKNF